MPNPTKSSGKPTRPGWFSLLKPKNLSQESSTEEFSETQPMEVKEGPAVNHFSDLDLIPSLQAAVREAGYTTPTPIQQQAIPHLLKGHDLLGAAQTGTGKTAAFALPILQRLSVNRRRPGPRQMRALVLAPTRELAVQIHESFCTYGRGLRMRFSVIFGGVSYNPQIRQLSGGVDVLIATPGRLLDLMKQNHVDTRSLEIFVLDEADRMLDMGFIHDIHRILATIPKERQSLFFSATMAKEVEKLASTLLTNPKRVSVTPVSSTSELIEQNVMFVDRAHKRNLLKHLLTDSNQSGEMNRVIVFTRTKHGANQVSEMLVKEGIDSTAIHGNKSQNARQKALDDFRRGKVRVLVATDVAARGIDVDGVTHVINFELPNVPEDYVHRIGRTARAGSRGVAISFCSYDERFFLRSIERLIRRRTEILRNHPFHSEDIEKSHPTAPPENLAFRPKSAGGRDRRRPSSSRKPRASAFGGRGSSRSAGRRDSKQGQRHGER